MDNCCVLWVTSPPKLRSVPTTRGSLRRFFAMPNLGAENANQAAGRVRKRSVRRAVRFALLFGQVFFRGRAYDRSQLTSLAPVSFVKKLSQSLVPAVPDAAVSAASLSTREGNPVTWVPRTLKRTRRGQDARDPGHRLASLNIDTLGKDETRGTDLPLGRLAELCVIFRQWQVTIITLQCTRRYVEDGGIYTASELIEGYRPTWYSSSKQGAPDGLVTLVDEQSFPLTSQEMKGWVVKHRAGVLRHRHRSEDFAITNSLGQGNDKSLAVAESFWKPWSTFQNQLPQRLVRLTVGDMNAPPVGPPLLPWIGARGTLRPEEANRNASLFRTAVLQTDSVILGTLGKSSRRSRSSSTWFGGQDRRGTMIDHYTLARKSLKRLREPARTYHGCETDEATRKPDHKPILSRISLRAHYRPRRLLTSHSAPLRGRWNRDFLANAVIAQRKAKLQEVPPPPDATITDYLTDLQDKVDRLPAASSYTSAPTLWRDLKEAVNTSIGQRRFRLLADGPRKPYISGQCWQWIQEKHQAVRDTRSTEWSALPADVAPEIVKAENHATKEVPIEMIDAQGWYLCLSPPAPRGWESVADLPYAPPFRWSPRWATKVAVTILEVFLRWQRESAYYKLVRWQVAVDYSEYCESISEQADQADRDGNYRTHHHLINVLAPRARKSAVTLRHPSGRLCHSKEEEEDIIARHICGLYSATEISEEAAGLPLPADANEYQPYFLPPGFTRDCIEYEPLRRSVPGTSLPIEVWILGLDILEKYLDQLFRLLAATGEVIPDWVHGLLLWLRKMKGEGSQMCHYRGIDLLDPIRKGWMRALLAPYRQIFNASMADPNQSAYLAERATLHPICSTTEIQRRYQKRSAHWKRWTNMCSVFGLPPHLVMIFVDLRAAVDLMDHPLTFPELQKIFQNQGILLTMQRLYNGICYKIKCKNGRTRFFRIKCGTRQGSVEGPFFWIVFYGAVMQEGERLDILHCERTCQRVFAEVGAEVEFSGSLEDDDRADPLRFPDEFLDASVPADNDLPELPADQDLTEMLINATLPASTTRITDTTYEELAVLLLDQVQDWFELFGTHPTIPEAILSSIQQRKNSGRIGGLREEHDLHEQLLEASHWLLSDPHGWRPISFLSSPPSLESIGVCAHSSQWRTQWSVRIEDASAYRAEWKRQHRLLLKPDFSSPHHQESILSAIRQFPEETAEEIG